MWKLDRPDTQNATAELLAALKLSGGEPVYKASKRQREGVLKLYSTYDGNIGAPGKKLKGSRFAEAFREAMYWAYDQVQERGRLSSLRALLKNVPGKCPYCGIGEIGDLDHYLPRSTYRLLSIYARNLIPCCHICNREKGTLASAQPTEHLAHAYLDTFPLERFFFAKIDVSHAGLKAMFYIQRSAGMTAEFAARLEYQADRFELNDRYSKAVNDFMGGQRTSIEDAGRKSPQALHTWLRATYLSFQSTYGLNDWRTALMQALAASDDFCNGGYKHCFGVKNPGA